MTTEATGRLDRMEQHLKLLKEESKHQSSDIILIKNALIGSEMNGNKGHIHVLKDCVEKLDHLEVKVEKNEQFIEFMRWFFRIAGSSAIGFVILKLMKVL